MEDFVKKTITVRGANSDPDLYEINKEGLKGWKLEEVRLYHKSNKVSYTYTKKKWWYLLILKIRL